MIVGNDGGTNVGASLYRAAGALGCAVTLANAVDAYKAPRPIARFNWWLRGRRPSRLEAFSQHVVDVCDRERPKWLIATGFAPVQRSALDAIRRLGVKTINYLTDDPWNTSFKSSWFLAALRAYDQVFSTRTRNLDDLSRHGCRQVTYLPFGVDQELFFPEVPLPSELTQLRSDVCFAGGADRDRVPYIGALLAAGLSVGLYGDYWNRFPETRAAWRGHAGPDVLRKATSAAAISLCLVRRANRDGHTMRSLEVPSIGGCMLTEDTDEHRGFFGESGHAVVYFRTPVEMVDRAKALVADPVERQRLASIAWRIIVEGGFTYRDRLMTMLGVHCPAALSRA